MKRGCPPIDIAGQRFGLLVALEIDHTFILGYTDRIAVWRCRCDCGRVKSVRSRDLRRKDGNAVRSCGCKGRTGK